MSVSDFAWRSLSVLGPMAAAYLFALPLGWERSKSKDAYVGLRTFPLVSVGAFAYLYLGNQLLPPGEHQARAYLLQGLMTGIGFIGGGAILKKGGDVRGVATAAAIWSTGAIGASVAERQYPIALVLCLANLIILHVTRRLARRFQHEAPEPEEE